MIDGFFDVIKGEPVIKPEALFIPELRALWDSDKDKNKSVATSKLCYVYHSISPISAYSQLGEPGNYIREDAVTKAFLRNIEKDTELLKVQEVYKALVIDADLDVLLLEGVKSAVRKLAKYLKDIEIVDGRGGNLSQIVDAVNKSTVLKAQKDQLTKQVQEGLEAQKHVKKGVRPNIFDEDYS